MRRPLIVPSPATEALPLGSDEFIALMRRLRPLPHPCRLAIAVSGGPDSMALAWCVQNNLFFFGAPALAFIVDHALRAESAEEAQLTQKRLKALGMHAEILRWEHSSITSQIHKTARQARYRLLLEACRKQGITHLALAHQREDQAETILMRLAKGSGVDGLAGIAADTLKEGVRLLRPFLSVEKERLIATCEAANLSFVTDPSNASSAYARGRLRRVIPLLADEGLTLDRLIDLGERAADAKAALDHATLLLLRGAGHKDETGALRLDIEPLRAAPRAIAQRAISSCLQWIHTASYVAEYASIRRVTEALCNDEEMPVTTLQGCLISKTKTHVLFQREVSAIVDAPSIKAGETLIWDGRWEVTVRSTDHTYTLRPLGHPPHELVDKLAPGLRQRVQQGRSRASMPALWQKDELVLIPSFAEKNLAPMAEVKLVLAWPPPAKS